MEIKDIASSFNLSIMAVLSEPLRLDDVLSMMKENGLDTDEILPTQILVNPRMLRLGVTHPGIKLSKINGSDLYAFNMQYPSMLRGIIQLNTQVIQVGVLDSDHISDFTKFVDLVGYGDKVHFYEVIIGFESNTPGFHSVKDFFPKLTTVSDPKLLTLRIFDGNVGERDLREEIWSEIQIEPIVTSPNKVLVNAVFRKKDVSNQLVEDAVTDIAKIFTTLEGVNFNAS